MSTVRSVRKYALAIGIAASLIAADEWSGNEFVAGVLFPQAQAEIGRPLTPGSVAGVARRTTRRTIRRSTVYVGALPRGCVRTSVNGVSIWRCGGTYYQPYGGRYAVVYID